MRMIKAIIVVTLLLANNGFAATSPSRVDMLKQRPNDILLGSKQAKVLVIEYSSLSCPSCAYFHKKTHSEIKEKYIDTGKIAYIYRDFPLDEAALRASMLARCANSKQFYTYIDVLFAQQNVWAYGGDFLEKLEKIAKLGGIENNGFKACMADKKIEELVLNNRLEAANILNVSATPTIFINGEKVTGAIDFDTFVKHINPYLER
jgi:protein-disulfide isomerase